MSSPFPYLEEGCHRTALISDEKVIDYGELQSLITLVAQSLLADSNDLQEERIAIFLPASIEYVQALHGVWRAGGVAVPLNIKSSLEELKYFLNTVNITRILTTDEHKSKLELLSDEMKISILDVNQLSHSEANLPSIELSRRAMILFTSGTTSKPKGVVTTHHNIHAQITTLIKAWQWTEHDAIPLFLPLHHVHGIINVLNCALWAGASIRLFSRFDLASICSAVANNEFTLFMAVPTIYTNLIDYLEAQPYQKKGLICDGFAKMRITISGSAGCPDSVADHWNALTGQHLLQRYGMTEVGMAISNPYLGERLTNKEGKPLPGVSVALFDEEGQEIVEDDRPGEIRIKGDSVFLEYWNNRKVTEESFVDGWFCTGDVAKLSHGSYKIMGRSSSDIIKSGGVKLSALEIESVLLMHESIKEVAVVGRPDDKWGESVTAYIVPLSGAEIVYPHFKAWCAEKMSPEKIPKSIHLVSSLPRNAMGKITKKQL